MTISSSVDDTGFAVWLTGLPAAGKSTVAAALARQLAGRGVRVQILDSDALRRVLTPRPTYDPEERDWFYRVMGFLGEILTHNGVNVVFAATANKRCHRVWARETISKFVEVYIACPLEVCRQRDPKGIYAQADIGQATTVPGIQDPYEPPATPEVTVNTAQLTADEGASRIVQYLAQRGWLGVDK